MKKQETGPVGRLLQSFLELYFSVTLLSIALAIPALIIFLFYKLILFLK